MSLLGHIPYRDSSSFRLCWARVVPCIHPTRWVSFWQWRHSPALVSGRPRKPFHYYCWTKLFAVDPEELPLAHSVLQPDPLRTTTRSPPSFIRCWWDWCQQEVGCSEGRVQPSQVGRGNNSVTSWHKDSRWSSVGLNIDFSSSCHSPPGPVGSQLITMTSWSFIVTLTWRLKLFSCMFLLLWPSMSQVDCKKQDQERWCVGGVLSHYTPTKLPVPDINQ